MPFGRDESDHAGLPLCKQDAVVERVLVEVVEVAVGSSVSFVDPAVAFVAPSAVGSSVVPAAASVAPALS